MSASLLYDGHVRTPAGIANRRARDRARMRALQRLFTRYRWSEAPEIHGRGWSGDKAVAARAIRDRHPHVWRAFYAEELGKERLDRLPMGRRS